jgi:hypothetical protein
MKDEERLCFAKRPGSAGSAGAWIAGRGGLEKENEGDGEEGRGGGKGGGWERVPGSWMTVKAPPRSRPRRCPSS